MINISEVKQGLHPRPSPAPHTAYSCLCSKAVILFSSTSAMEGEAPPSRPNRNDG
jgi:hypothetical protein